MLGRRAALRVAAGALGLAGCSSTVTPPTPTVSPTSTPTPSTSVPTRNFLEPGEATLVVRELVAAAGTINAIKVELSATEAVMSVVSGMTAKTWGWRNGAVVVIDSDTQFVGQAIFDPRDYDVSDLAGMFDAAATMAKSSSGQQLQIVEYADRAVYMTVTTNPESLTVFFRKDGRLISHVDLTTLAGIQEAYTDVVGSKKAINALGILPNQGGMYVDVAVLDTIVRTVRQPRLPARSATRRETTTLSTFDPARVKPEIIYTSLQRIHAKAGAATPQPGWSLVVSTKDGTPDPRMYFSVNGVQTIMTLAGVDVTPH
ncbi:MAG TPA: hypothetical protein VLR88_00495 [Propionibacteriaceae bacterium]|nr:hypothetical protein [Propionibacteriaceae bacterium]